MCVVSMVMDQYKPFIPPAPWRVDEPWRAPPVYPRLPQQPPVITPIVDPEKLQELIDSFHEAVKAAERFDGLTGQPDCEDPEKGELRDRITELEEQLADIREAAADR